MTGAATRNRMPMMSKKRMITTLVSVSWVYSDCHTIVIELQIWTTWCPGQALHLVKIGAEWKTT